MVAVSMVSTCPANGVVSLMIGAASVLLALLPGVLLGLLAAFHPHWVSPLVMRVMDVLLALPGLLLAIGIPFINPRSGRSGSLIMTLASFFTYYNMVNMSRNWVVMGKLSMTDMMLALHLPVFLLAWLILYWRQQQGMFFKKRRATPATQGTAA